MIPKIKYKWKTIALELMAVITALVLFNAMSPSSTVLLLLLFIILLARERSVVTPFIVCFTVLAVLWNIKMGRFREEPDLFIWEEMVERLENLSQDIQKRIDEDERLLLSLEERVRRTGMLDGGAGSSPQVFKLIAEMLDEHTGRGVVLFDQDLEWVAWGGKIRGINAQMIRDVSESGRQARLQKGAVYTVLTMAYPVRNERSEVIGVLFLDDLIAVDDNIKHAALLREGFMNTLRPSGERMGTIVPESTGVKESGALPIKAFGKQVGLLNPLRVAELRETIHFTDAGRKLLALILLLPLLYVFWTWLRKFDTVFNSRMRETAHPYPWLFLWLLSGGFLFLALRMALLRLEIPGDFWDTDIFSPNLFASGLLDAGSRSIGDFFISSFFIVTITFRFLLKIRWLGTERGRPTWKSSRVLVGSIAVLIPVSMPFVFMRLLEDTSGQLLISGRPFESLAFVIWEGSIFILALAALFTSAGLLLLAVGDVRKRTIPLTIFSLSAGMLFYLLTGHPGQILAHIRLITIAISGISASFVLASLAGSQSSFALGIRSVGFLLAGVLFATLTTFPVILQERYTVLINNAEELFEVALKPIDTWVTFTLEEFIEDTEVREEQILAELATRELAFALWASSPLAGTGMASSLSIYNNTGRQLSTFSLLADPIPVELVDYLREEITNREESFIYTGFVGGEQYYIAAIPLGKDQPPSGMLLARLPTGLKRRIAPHTVPFLRSESPISPGGIVSVSLIQEERNIPWQLSHTGGENKWIKMKSGFSTGSGSLASIKYIESEDRWLLVQIQLTGVSMLLGMMMATLLLNILFVVPSSFIFFLSHRNAPDEKTKSSGRFFHGTFRARLTFSLFIFSLIPTLIWGFLSRGAIIERMERETRTEAERILRDSSPFLIENNDSTAGSYLPFTSDKRMAELAETIGAELFLYSGNKLVSSSRPDLIQSGIMMPWMAGNAFVELFLEGFHTTNDLLEIGSVPYIMVYRRLGLVEGVNDLVLATPMLLRQGEIREEVVEFSYSLLIVIMSMLGGSILMGLLVASLLAQPLRELRRGTGQIADGNLEYQLDGQRVDEFGELYVSFNEMARRLKISHLELLSEKSKMESILKNVGAGVLVLDGRGQLQINNEMASSLVGEDLSSFHGEVLNESSLTEGSWGIFISWITDPQASGEKQFEVEINGRKTFVRAAKTLARSAHEEALHVIIFEDVTEGIRSQRILAWADLARQIAHEIKNPLTPIRLAVQHLRRLYRDRAPDFEERLEENVDLILREIERLGRIASQFSTFAKAERTSPTLVDIAPVIEEVLALYLKAESEVSFRFTSEMKEIEVLSNGEDFRKVLINLLENSRDSMPHGGTISITVQEWDEWIRLTVGDTGEGIPAGLVDRVFEPDFTTRTEGTGLGLTIVKRLVEGWGGKVEITSELKSGTQVTIYMKRTS